MSEGGTDRPRLLLVGAGHVHLEVLRRLALDPSVPLDATILTLDERHFYSGMTPGYLAGQYSVEDLSSNVPAIARRAGARCVVGRAVSLDPAARTVGLEGGERLSYDLVSLNIGSLLVGGDSDAARHAERIKPLNRAARLRERLVELARADANGAVRVVVVGAGAGGYEVACAAGAMLDRAGQPRHITLLDAGEEILPGYSDRFRTRAEQAAAELGIRVETGRRVSRVEPDRVLLEGGGEIESDLAIWLTGAVGAPLLAESGLPTDRRGFLWIDDALRSVADHRVFAVGDCGTLQSAPNTPKAGVYAVREAPVLWENLLAAAREQELARFEPQSGFLSILNTCEGRALLRYKWLVSWSRWAWWLKDRIDRGFMRKYQRLAE